MTKEIRERTHYEIEAEYPGGVRVIYQQRQYGMFTREAAEKMLKTCIREDRCKRLIRTDNNVTITGMPIAFHIVKYEGKSVKRVAITDERQAEKRRVEGSTRAH